MTQIKKLMTLALACVCIFASITGLIFSSAASSTDSSQSTQSSSQSTNQSSATTSSQQAELADKLPNGKKQLKKQMSWVGVFENNLLDMIQHFVNNFHNINRY
jgi:ABC-type enterochelin transport system substrate-binding protein